MGFGGFVAFLKLIPLYYSIYWLLRASRGTLNVTINSYFCYLTHILMLFSSRNGWSQSSSL